MCSHFFFFSVTVSEVPEAQIKIPDTPGKKKLKSQIKTLREWLQQEWNRKSEVKSLRLKNTLKCLKQYLQSDTMSFIESQVVMSQRSKSAYRWKMKDKMLALSIFFTAIKHTEFYHIYLSYLQ